jgi:phage terminase large subunit GpA-like protein
MASDILGLINSVLTAWKPPKNLLVSEWADEYRRLSPESSAEPGQWRTDRVPYLKSVLDAINNPAVEEIIVCSSAQIGKTELLLSVLGYFAHQDPSPILFVLPTIELAETISKDRLSPMIRDTPVLKKRFAANKTRQSNSTILHKIFDGGRITLCGSNSPASLSSRPCRIILCDEVDRFTNTVTEGDVVNLAKKRASTFFNRKFILTSTPTLTDTSRIWWAYQASDQQRFFVPCPHCKESQVLMWKQVKWEKESPELAWYECEYCGEGISNVEKNKAIRQGQWRSTAAPPKGREGAKGFHVSAFYSPWMTLGDVVKEFLSAKDDPALLQTWTNLCLGEPWNEDEGEQVEWQQLIERCEPYAPLTVPNGALLLTAGVDVQSDRLEVSVWGWGSKEESWLIYHAVLWGEPLEQSVWTELDLFLDTTFDHESGATLKISATAIDTGYLSNEIYNFVRLRPGRGLYATKGMSTPGRPVLGKPTPQEVSYRGKTLKKSVRLWPIGVDTAKGLLYARLRLPKSGPGYLHFPIGTEQEYFEQLTAERRVTKYIKGFAKSEWVKVRKRNEALDCLVYAYAAAHAVGINRIDWEKLKNRLMPKPVETKEVPPESLEILPVVEAKSKKSKKRHKNWMQI